MTASTNDLRSKQDVFKQRPAILESSVLDRPGRAAPRTEAKRARIVDAAMQHFAEHGYHAARIEDLSAQLGVAKGSIFQYFGSKGGLFLEAYKKAVRSFPTYLDSPPQIREKGFLRSCATGCLKPNGWFARTGFPIAWRCWAITAWT